RKDQNGGDDKGYIRRRSVAPAPSSFPNTPADQAHERHRQRNPQAEVCQPKLKKWSDDAVPRFLQQRTKHRGRSKIGSATHLEKGSSKFLRILCPAGMPLEHRSRAKVIGNQPDKKTRWNQCNGQHRDGVYANRRVPENFRPPSGVRNQATESGAAFVAS